MANEKIDQLADTVVVGDDQMGFLEEMLNEGTEFIDPELHEEVPEKLDAESEKLEALEPDKPVEKKEPEESVEAPEGESIIESMRAQILALTEQLSVDPLKQGVKGDVSSDGEQKVKDVISNFLSPEELDRLIDEPELINTAFQRSQTAMLASVGELVQQEVGKQIMINRAVSDFYQTNQDLQPYAKLVRFVMAETEAKNKDKTYAEIFEMSAIESRKRLGLSTVAPAINRETNKGNPKPAFAGSKRGNARPASQKEFFDSNAKDMFDLL